MFLKYSLKLQILLGAVFGLLNYGVNLLQETFNPVPLYMDTLFTVAASFFGAASGVICAATHHAMSSALRAHTLSSFSWSICSFTVVLIIRLFVRWHNKNVKKEPEVFELLILIFIVVIAISFEGALIFTILHAAVQYREDSQARQMYLLLSRNNIPVFVSAFLPRLPINILDKGICVSLGYLCFKQVKKLFSPKTR